MARTRRSGRIAKEVAILVAGTDVGGRVFSEETQTVALSRHGAGILSRYKIAPEEILSIRLVGESREAVVRLVGPMGQRLDGCIYGVAFCDPDLDFWRIEFPPATPADHPAALEPTVFECVICHERELVDQSDIEADVFAINENILRQCHNCGFTTNWIQPPPGSPLPLPAAKLPDRPALQLTSDLAQDPSRASTPNTTATLELPRTESFYSAAPPAMTLTRAIDLPGPALASAPAPVPMTGKKNRRQHLRASVSYIACIRHPTAGDEIVECDNISKGGFSFRSRKQYFEESIIEAAVPYNPGWSPIFVSAQIKHVDILPGGTLFRYGVAYLQSPSSFSRF